MFYEYKCSKCSEITTLMLPMSEDTPKSTVCEQCGAIAPRSFASVKIHIPEDFKAMSDICPSDSYASLDNLKSRFKHSRPSGRTEKIYY
jgi:putative FmdB family regulatory protein